MKLRKINNFIHFYKLVRGSFLFGLNIKLKSFYFLKKLYTFQGSNPCNHSFEGRYIYELYCD